MPATVASYARCLLLLCVPVHRRLPSLLPGRACQTFSFKFQIGQWSADTPKYGQFSPRMVSLFQRFPPPPTPRTPTPTFPEFHTAQPTGPFSYTDSQWTPFSLLLLYFPPPFVHRCTPSTVFKEVVFLAVCKMMHFFKTKKSKGKTKRGPAIRRSRRPPACSREEQTHTYSAHGANHTGRTTK